MPYSHAIKNEDDISAVTWFVEEALSVVSSHWGKSLTRQNEYMSTVVTRTDEAFVLWTLKTSEESWVQELEADGKSKGGEEEADDEEKGPNRFGTEAAMELYEQIVENVQKTRDCVNCEDWDKQLLGHFRDKSKKTTKRVVQSRKNKKRRYEKNFDLLVDNF